MATAVKPAAVRDHVIHTVPLIVAVILVTVETILWFVQPPSISNFALAMLVTVVRAAGWPGLFVGLFFQGLTGGKIHGDGKLSVLLISSGVTNLIVFYGCADFFREIIERLRRKTHGE